MRKSTFHCKPFLLHFAEPVEPMLAPTHRYDPTMQCEEVDALFAGTQRTQSFQNSTSCYSALTGYEDYDDQWVTRSD